jgi:hypothetical protein
MRKRRMVLWAVVAFTAISWIITMVVNVSLCHSISAYWTVYPEIVEAECVPNSGMVLWLVTWTLHFTSDIMRRLQEYRTPLCS